MKKYREAATACDRALSGDREDSTSRRSPRGAIERGSWRGSSGGRGADASGGLACCLARVSQSSPRARRTCSCRRWVPASRFLKPPKRGAKPLARAVVRPPMPRRSTCRGKVARESLSANIIALVTRADQISLTVPVMFGSPAFVLGGSADQRDAVAAAQRARAHGARRRDPRGARRPAARAAGAPGRADGLRRRGRRDHREREVRSARRDHDAPMAECFSNSETAVA